MKKTDRLNSAISGLLDGWIEIAKAEYKKNKEKNSPTKDWVEGIQEARDAIAKDMSERLSKSLSAEEVKSFCASISDPAFQKGSMFLTGEYTALLISGGLKLNKIVAKKFFNGIKAGIKGVKMTVSSIFKIRKAKPKPA